MIASTNLSWGPRLFSFFHQPCCNTTLMWRSVNDNPLTFIIPSLVKCWHDLISTQLRLCPIVSFLDLGLGKLKIKRNYQNPFAFFKEAMTDLLGAMEASLQIRNPELHYAMMQSTFITMTCLAPSTLSHYTQEHLFLVMPAKLQS